MDEKEKIIINPPEYWKNLSLDDIVYFDEEGKEQTELWRNVRGYEGLYKVSNCGRVKSLHKESLVFKNNHNYFQRKLERVLAGTITAKGYRSVVLTTNDGDKAKGKLTHILVAESFLIKKNNNHVEVNHKDGNKLNAYYENLEWCTKSENQLHCRRILKKGIGDNHCHSKLTSEGVVSIVKSKFTPKELSSKYNVSISTIKDVLGGRTWQHLTRISLKISDRTSPYIVMGIFNSNLPRDEIAKKFGVKKSFVTDVKLGRNWSNITGKTYVSKTDILKLPDEITLVQQKINRCDVTYDKVWSSLQYEDLLNEKWAPINGYDGKYEISNFARIRSLSRPIKSMRWGYEIIKSIKGRILKHLTGNYPSVSLSKNGKLKMYQIHVILAKAFIPNPNELPVVNHLNGIKQDLTLSNLEWNTYKGNTKHALETGLIVPVYGERQHNASLTNVQALEIFNSNESFDILSDRYNISRGTVSNIKLGNRWSKVTGKKKRIIKEGVWIK